MIANKIMKLKCIVVYEHSFDEIGIVVCLIKL